MSLGLMVIVTIAINMVTHLINVGKSLLKIIRRQNSKGFVKTAIDMDIVPRSVGLSKITICGLHTEQILEATELTENLTDHMLQSHGITIQGYGVNVVEDMDI
ncbi:hypothetical protein ACR2V4_27155 [Klebsiella pneumoniae]